MGGITLRTQIAILLEQIFIMFLLMGAGFVIYRLGMLPKEMTRQLSNLLVKIVTPFTMICSFQRAFDLTLAKTLAIVLVCGFLTFFIGIAVSALLYRPAKFENYANRRMCATYSNNGFMALPLLNAMFGPIGVFLGSAHIVASTVLTWTYSVPQLCGGKAELKKIVLNPGTIALILGTLLFVSPVKVPGPVFTAMNYLGSLNTPLAMLIVGSYLAQTDLLSAFRDLSILRNSLVRLLLIPGLALLFLLFTPLDETARMALLIGVSAPVAISNATFAQIFDSDYLYCTKAVAVSTVLSIATMPLMIALYAAAHALIP